MVVERVDSAGIALPCTLSGRMNTDSYPLETTRGVAPD